jgi:hypothetical protein
MVEMQTAIKSEFRRISLNRKSDPEQIGPNKTSVVVCLLFLGICAVPHGRFVSEAITILLVSDNLIRRTLTRRTEIRSA